MVRDARIADPFGLASTPSAYVPREASERTIREFDKALAVGRIPALVGPPGFGKTLILQRVAARVEERVAAVYVPYSTLELSELCALVLGLVEEPLTQNPEHELREIIQELGRQRASLLILIDDVAMMPKETAQALGKWVDAYKGALKLGVAGVDSQKTEEVFRALGERVMRMRVDQPMSFEETRAYVSRRLSIVGASQHLRDAFGDEEIRELYRQSEGNPRAVNLAAQPLVRAATPDDAPLLRQVYDPARTRRPIAQTPMPAPDFFGTRPSAPQHGGPVPLSALAPGAPDDGSYRVVRGRRVENASDALGADERSARAGDDDASSARRSPLARVQALRRARRSPLQRLLAFGDRIARKPAAVAFTLVVAVAAGLVVGSLTTPSEGGSYASTAKPVAEAVPVAYPIGINATPWAAIEVDGKPVGETPLAGLELSAGPHTIRAVFPDGSVQERMVQVDANTRSVIFE